jgi:hypothetical protein
MSQNPPTPLAAGGARQRRNYQQEVIALSMRQEARSKNLLGASFLSVQKATLGTVSCRPRAGSVLQQHGAKALRGQPRN